jgi:glutamate 5-kinase
MGVIPIVNENDTIAVAEIKFGDNDTLSAVTAAMVHADFLFLMTDVDCLYDKNPRTNPDAQPIQVVEDINSIQADGILPPPFPLSHTNYADMFTVSSAGSSLGTGGMSTKIVAAKLATSAGVTTVITKSSKPDNIHQIVRYVQAMKSLEAPSRAASTTGDADEPLSKSTASLAPPIQEPPLHTRFLPFEHPIRDRYFWLLHGLAPHGAIYIDAGAHRALADKAGLLPAGILDVEGSFAQHEAVRIVVVERRSSPGADGKTWEGTPHEVGRALVNYAAPEIARIKGQRSSKIESLLGYADSQYIADRDNIRLFLQESRPASPMPDMTSLAEAAGK